MSQTNSKRGGTTFEWSDPAREGYITRVLNLVLSPPWSGLGKRITRSEGPIDSNDMYTMIDTTRVQL